MNNNNKYELPQKSPLEPVPIHREDLGVFATAAAIIIRVKQVT
jgi:hypothetical protein